MSINTDVLRTLVIWAAEDHIRGTDPEKAVSLGLAAEGDKRLGRWNQEAWGEGKRNGICQTAFCIAGAAVALDDSVVVAMSKVSEYDKITEYSASYVVAKALVPEGSDTKHGYWWINDATQDAYDMLGEENVTHISEHGRNILGLETEQSNLLFNGSNEIEQVVSYAEAFAAHEGKTLGLPPHVMEFYEQHNAEYVEHMLSYNG